GGRVIPFFTARRFQFAKPEANQCLDLLANAPLLALFILSFFPLSMAQLGQPIMVFVGLAQLIRSLRWKPWRTYQEPSVWSLHLFYFCIPLSLFLRGLLDNAFITHNLIHLFAIGAL